MHTGPTTPATRPAHPAVPRPLRARAGRVLLALILALWADLLTAPTALAVQGGGSTPIGAPWAKTVLYDNPGPYEFISLISSAGPFGEIRAQADVNATSTFVWPAYAGHQADNAEAYADDKGVFWTSAFKISGIAPDGPARDGVTAMALWAQRFRKDSDAAWMTFTVTNARVHVEAAAGAYFGPGDQGSRGVLMATGDLLRPDGAQATFFEQGLDLEYNVPDGWFLPESSGPMNCPLVVNEPLVREAVCDRYTGHVDLSRVARGETFHVFFEAFSYAETSPLEGDTLVYAEFRDPLDSGGGIILETEGLTPLDAPFTAPIPSDRALAVTTQPDGKVVAAGYAYGGADYDVALARYDVDGRLDPSFGSGGKVTTDLGGGADAAYAVAVQPDGKIVVAGSARTGTGDDFALVRYSSAGALDPSFGDGTGMALLDFGGRRDIARGVAIQPDGKIVVVGYTWTGSRNVFALARFDSSGVLDTAGFGGGTGMVTTDFAGGSALASAVVLQPDGSIVAAGSADGGPAATGADLALARYLDDGRLDVAFGDGSGKVTLDVAGGTDLGEAVALQPDGKVVVAGQASGALGSDFLLARFDPDGRPDPGFGSGGATTLGFASGPGQAHALTIQADGAIVAAGHAYNGANDDVAVARFDRTGAPDTTFGAEGRAVIDLDGGDDRAYAVAIQAGDGRIVAAGYAVTGAGDDFALVRLNP